MVVIGIGIGIGIGAAMVVIGIGVCAAMVGTCARSSVAAGATLVVSATATGSIVMRLFPKPSLTVRVLTVGFKGGQGVILVLCGRITVYDRLLLFITVGNR